MNSVSAATPTTTTSEWSPVRKSQLIGLFGGVFCLVIAMAFTDSGSGIVFGIIGAVVAGLILLAASWFWFYARTLPGGRESYRHTFWLAWCVLTNMGSRDIYTD